VSDFDFWTWGALSAGASARGRQCFVLQPGSAPVKSGRYRIAWLDDDGEVMAWWTADERGPTAGWGDERPLLMTLETDARHELARAVRSFGDRRDRRVEIMEMV
jgi:hypothetical protein